MLGLLGPNGAGKTTAVRILTTLLQPDGGTRARRRASTSLADAGRAARADRARRPVRGGRREPDRPREPRDGRPALPPGGASARERARRAARAIRPQPTPAGGSSRTYSGGMRRRLDLAAALVARPPVLFLDEPTTGLDPRSRIGLWETIEGLVAEGTTVLLTTQYLDEADRLADRIAVIDHGTRDRRGHARRAQGAGRRRAARGPARRRVERRARRSRRSRRCERRPAVASDGSVLGRRSASAAARSPRRCAGSTTAGSRSTTSPSSRRRSTTCSSAHRPRRRGRGEEQSDERRRSRDRRTRWSSPSAASCASRASPTCWSASRSSRSCSCCCSSTSSAARSRRRASSYVDFLIPGIIVQSMAFGGFVTALGLSDDLKKGLIDRFRSLPMSRAAVLTGRTLADIVHELAPARRHARRRLRRRLPLRHEPSRGPRRHRACCC